MAHAALKKSHSEEISVLSNSYDHIVASREIDILEQDYTQRGEAFFHVSGSGHENMAFLAHFLNQDDYLHCHYRDKSLMLARGVSVRQFFLSLFCKDESHSRGRQMSAHLSDPERHVLSLTGPVGNNALQAAGVAAQIKNRASNPIVYCGLGEGTSQQGEVLEAIAQAVRETLPVLFVVQDNSFAISTKTAGKTFYSHPEGEVHEFYGVPITYLDGRDALECLRVFGREVLAMRESRRPSIIVFQVDRLNSHTNADDHRVYRSAEEIAAVRAKSDPVTLLETLLKREHPEIDWAARRQQIKAQVLAVAEEAQNSPEPEPFHDAKAPLAEKFHDAQSEYRGSVKEELSQDERLVMLEAIREVLKNHLAVDERVFLFGQDIEDPKGDVFGITKGLSTSFPGRVVNSPLTESTIVGYGAGRALAGARPVCFLQFADFFPIAFNQIWSEIASMFWRTDGGWKTPVIVMVTCGGFKPGLGPFHASSMESFAAHVPGIDVFLPSSAGDAAGLLNAAFESERPTIFFYPKSSLNDRSQSTSRDIFRHFVPLGKARFRRHGSRLTMVGWGNTMNLLEKAAEALESVGSSVDVIDLRSLSPWDKNSVIESVRKTGRLIIAQEDNESVSMASEISATVSETLAADPEVISRGGLRIKRVSRADTFVPCNFGNQLAVLPSYQRILECSVALLDGEISWTREAAAEAGFDFIPAIGSSPSDESITVIDWKVKPGDRIEKGQLIAEAEADKAAFEINAPIAGILADILIPAGEMTPVGNKLLKLKVSEGAVQSKKAPTQENPGVPSITLPVHAEVKSPSQGPNLIVRTAQSLVAGIAGLASRTGSRIMPNEEIVKLSPDWSAEDIYKRVGIRSRYWASAEESALSMATDAARQALVAQGLRITDIDLLLVTTGTPPEITPSLACMVLSELSRDPIVGPRPEELGEPVLVQANDLNAACSGYLYGLQSAYDFLAQEPEARVLLVTSELLSRTVDMHDIQTAPIFGDAATATVIVGQAHAADARIEIERPVLGAKGEDGSILKLPRDPRKFIFMDGPKVYVEAVRHMLSFLDRACKKVGLSPDKLDLVIPHQANQRIINAVRQRAKLPEEKVYSAIAEFGNTSSSSIPLCLNRLWDNVKKGETWGLCAFGGGFTFGGAVLKTR